MSDPEFNALVGLRRCRVEAPGLIPLPARRLRVVRVHAEAIAEVKPAPPSA
jgi:hypothetical protein